MEGAKFLGSWEIVGMMYWTTTGMFESIKKRNSTMWGPDNRPTALTELWMAGFGEAITSRLPTYVSSTDYTNGVTLKVFMPNIVMIDFADIHKGRFIFELNMKASTELTQTARKIEQVRTLAQGQGGGRRQQRRPSVLNSTGPG